MGKQRKINKNPKNIRKTSVQLPEYNSPSTVLMTSMEVDGKQVSVPTLFPKDPNNQTNDPKDWIQLKGIEAYKEAKKREEVWEFKTQEEAQSFAKGSWKNEKEKQNTVNYLENKNIEPFYNKNINNMKNTKPIPKYVWGALISTGLNAGLTAISNNQEQKALDRERRRQLQLERNNKFVDDKMLANNFEEKGTYADSFYLQEGGTIPSNSSFSTTGGVLQPTSSDTQKVIGNSHNENNIDGVNGVRLNENGQDIAEVENQEIIKDDAMVFSDKLSPNGNKTFAQIAEELSRKKGQLEKEMTDPNVTKEKANTLKREIEKIEIDEDRLFEKQEVMKQEQEVLNQPLPNPDGQVPDNTAMQSLIGGNQNPQMAQGSEVPNEVNQEQQIMEAMGTQQPIMKKGGNIPKYTLGTRDVKNENFFGDDNENSITLGKADTESGFKKSAKAAMPYLDNAVNLVNTLTKPKVPKPVLTQKRSQRTDIDVTNQLNDIDQAVERAAGFAKDNSSSSKSARGSVIDARLKGANARNNVLTNKRNQEMQLENQASRVNMQLDSQNNALVNNYNQTNLDRNLDIRRELSQNASEAVDSYSRTEQTKINQDNLEKNRELMKYQYDLLAEGTVQRNDLIGTNNSYMPSPDLDLKSKNFTMNVLKNFNSNLEFTGTKEELQKISDEVSKNFGMSLEQYLEKFVVPKKN